ncbi:acyl-[acyl-carrier-protein] thioesterase [Sunxiuqinia sp. A32]|uniref:acyl-[acyl-carrier-protein] thioesterase n=1 Tax=Sunxiuqinia sp. A32 TaxID=3461496 RepID=UPI004045D788
MKKYIETLQVKSYHTNQFAKASVPMLFNFMLEAAWAHAQVMDWGYDQLKSSNLFWVLSRMYVEFEKYPSWQDEIVLNTWSAGTDGMYAYRDFILETKTGELILKASTSWLILEHDTKKIFLLRNYRDTFPKLESNDACRNPKRIKPIAHPNSMSFVPVQFSELDVNMHFNSVKYLERVINDFGIEFLNNNELASIEVNYLKEGMANDSLAVVHKKMNETEYLSGIVREADKLDLCAIHTKWKERN